MAILKAASAGRTRRLVERGPNRVPPPPTWLANPLSFTHNSRVKPLDVSFGEAFLGDFGGMSSFRNVGLGATLAVALSWAMLPTAGYAYTPEEQQACQPDAMRICGNFIPDVDRITACMIQNKSQLSPECRKYFRGGPEPEATAVPAARPGKPVNIKPATTIRKSKPKAKAKKTAKPAAT